MSATPKDVTDPRISYYRPVPKGQDGVCDVCHGAPGQGWDTCWSCDRVMGQVSHPAFLVVPISLTIKYGPLYEVLIRYKRPSDTSPRRDARLLMAATLVRFLEEHGQCLESAAKGTWDTITIVPSTRNPPPHALEEVMQMSSSLGSAFLPTLKRGPVSIGHHEADDNGFALTKDVRNRSILLIDDTFTTGARSQSAASALALGGARVRAILTVARVIDPTFNDESEALWEKAIKTPFTFEVCCIHP